MYIIEKKCCNLLLLDTGNVILGLHNGYKTVFPKMLGCSMHGKKTQNAGILFMIYIYQ